MIDAEDRTFGGVVIRDGMAGVVPGGKKENTVAADRNRRVKTASMMAAAVRRIVMVFIFGGRLIVGAASSGTGRHVIGYRYTGMGIDRPNGKKHGQSNESDEPH